MRRWVETWLARLTEWITGSWFQRYISEWAICDFQYWGDCWWARKGYNQGGAGTAIGLNRDQIVKIARLIGCKNFVDKRKKLMRIFHRSHEAPSQCRSTPHQHSLCCFSRLHRTFSALSFAPFPLAFICFYLHPHHLFAFCFLDANAEPISLCCDWTGVCPHLADDCGQIRCLHLVRKCYSAWWPWQWQRW